MSEKVCIFNGNSEGPINSQGAVFLSSSYNESSRGRNNPGKGGVSCEKAVWGLIVVLGTQEKGAHCCTGHVAILEKRL